MRDHSRWFAPLLRRPIGTTLFVRKHYPDATFKLDKRTTRDGKMIRHIRFELEGKTLMYARAEVDISTSKPRVVQLLQETPTPMGEIIRRFKVRRTRIRCTTRTREFHFVGDLNAKIWERFYACHKTPAVPIPL